MNQNPRVLIVDDEQDNRILIRMMLENAGITQIHEAGDGKEAIKQLAAFAFDLVITDRNMPELNGDQLVAEIRESFTQEQLPVIMITADNLKGDKAPAGVNILIAKPFRPEQIWLALTTLAAAPSELSA